MSGKHERRDPRGLGGRRPPRPYLLGAPAGPAGPAGPEQPEDEVRAIADPGSGVRPHRPPPLPAPAAGRRLRRAGAIVLPVVAVALVGALIVVQSRETRTGARSSATMRVPRSSAAAPPKPGQGVIPPNSASPSPGTGRRTPGARRSSPTGSPAAPPQAPPGRGRGGRGAANGGGGTGRPVRLFELVGQVEADGPSGVRRTATVNGRRSTQSTGFWVGCDGVPAVTRFTLGGRFRDLTTTLALDPSAPADLNVRVVIEAGGNRLADRTVGNGRTAGLDVPTSGVGTLTLKAEAANGGACGVSADGYGIAFDAVVHPR